MSKGAKGGGPTKPRFCTHCGNRLEASYGTKGTPRPSCTCDEDGVAVKLNRFCSRFGDRLDPLPPEAPNLFGSPLDAGGVVR